MPTSTALPTHSPTLTSEIVQAIVQGHAKPDSDLDLAALVAAYADPLRLWDVASAVGGWPILPKRERCMAETY